MTIIDKLNKYITEENDPIKVNFSIKDAKMIRKSIMEELQAINDYTKRAYEAENPAVKELFLDIAYEEKVHFGELEEVLEMVDPEHETAEEEGEEEVEELVAPKEDNDESY